MDYFLIKLVTTEYANQYFIRIATERARKSGLDPEQGKRQKPNAHDQELDVLGSPEQCRSEGIKRALTHK